MKYGVNAHLDIYNIFILSFPVILYNIYFLFAVKFDNFYVQIMKILTFMILETCVNDFVKICKISQTHGFKRGKHPAIGQYKAKYHSTTSEETVVSCSYWLKNHHVISSQISYGLLYVKFWAIPLQMVGDKIFKLRPRLSTFSFTWISYFTLKDRQTLFISLCSVTLLNLIND